VRNDGVFEHLRRRAKKNRAGCCAATCGIAAILATVPLRPGQGMKSGNCVIRDRRAMMGMVSGGKQLYSSRAVVSVFVRRPLPTVADDHVRRSVVIVVVVVVVVVSAVVVIHG